jgi:hypothetical protein
VRVLVQREQEEQLSEDFSTSGAHLFLLNIGALENDHAYPLAKWRFLDAVQMKSAHKQTPVGCQTLRSNAAETI